MSRRVAAAAVLWPIVLPLLACGGAPSPVAPGGSHALDFIADDWPRALVAAKERQVPIFVEAWAPW